MTGTLSLDIAHERGIKSAVAKLLTTVDDYMDFFTKEVEGEIVEDMPDFLKESLNPALLTVLVSFSILYMFLPDYAKKKKYEKVTFKNLQSFINESGDPDKPRILVPKEFQPYILRDLPRKVKENLPVPNWTEGMVYHTFKTVPDDKQDEAKEIVTKSINNGEDVPVLTKRLVDKLGIKESNAVRIAEAEIRRARHWAYNQISEQLGYTKKKFRSFFGACKRCKSLDGKIFDVSVQVIPDMTHPYCNCALFIIPSSRVPPLGT